MSHLPLKKSYSRFSFPTNEASLSRGVFPSCLRVVFAPLSSKIWTADAFPSQHAACKGVFQNPKKQKTRQKKTTKRLFVLFVLWFFLEVKDTIQFTPHFFTSPTSRVKPLPNPNSPPPHSPKKKKWKARLTPLGP